MDKQKFYGTFGQGHLFQNHCVLIYADDFNQANEFMHLSFGSNFSHVAEAEFENSEYFSKPLFIGKIDWDDDSRRQRIKCIQVAAKPFFPPRYLHDMMMLNIFGIGVLGSEDDSDTGGIIQQQEQQADNPSAGQTDADTEQGLQSSEEAFATRITHPETSFVEVGWEGEQADTIKDKDLPENSS